MGKKKQITWFEKGKVKVFVSPSYEQIKRVKAAAKGRGATDISRIVPVGSPAPISLAADFQRIKEVLKRQGR